MEQPILPLRDAPVLADAAAVWFSRRWGIPAESYRESMEQCLRRKAPVPQWYVVRDGGRLLDFIRRDLGAMGIPRLYLVTDHTAFYERYGWTFLTMVTGDDHLPERMYTAPTLPPRPAPVCRRTQSALDIPRVSGDNVRCYFL